MDNKLILNLINLGLLVVVLPACSPGTSAVPTKPPPTVTFISTTAKRTATQVPLARPSTAQYLLAYDPDRAQVIMIGALFSTFDVWAYDVSNQKLTRMMDKPAVSVMCAEYHPMAKGVITYTGSGSTTLYFNPSGNEWRELAKGPPDAMVSPGISRSCEYDPALDRIVILTGIGAEESRANTSFYDFSTNLWEVKKTVPIPPFEGILAYDEESDRLLLWDFRVERNMYVFDPKVRIWEKLTYTGGPNQGGLLSTMVYVSDLDRVFAYIYDQFYAYDFNTNTWEQAKGELKPGSRIFPSMVYDPIAKKIVLYGGYRADFETPISDLWLYDPQTSEWTEQELP